MSNNKPLFDVIENMRALAASLQAAADAMADGNIQDARDKAVKTMPVASEKPTTIADVRAVLGKKENAAAHALIREYGAEKLSEVDPALFGRLLKDAEGLKDAGK